MATQIKWYENELMVLVEGAKRKALRRVGRVIANRAKGLCPVGEMVKPPAKGGAQWTGRVPGTLKKSIRYKLTKKGNLQVIAGGRSKRDVLTAYYAVQVEFGTSKMAERPFLRPALAQSAGDIEAMFKDQLP
jgi:HK97 gp10 family phage protein